MNNNYLEEYAAWTSYADLDGELKAELDGIKEDRAGIEDRFYSPLMFGTAGLRGVLGAGLNRMNIYVVRQATAGLARYILKTGGEDAAQRGVAIAYDSRLKSDVFAVETALTLAKFGIKAHLYDGIRSVPQLSFTIRHMNCIAGVVITASHNPPEYNGYKVFWSDGGQLPPERCTGVMNEIQNIGIFETTPISRAAAERDGLLHIIGAEVDEAYYEAIMSLRLHNELGRDAMSTLKVVYTPLHGAGAIPVKTILGRMGVDVITVPEQEMPDGHFPTVDAPNPEYPAAFTLAKELAKKVGAKVILATDPDSDRLGVGVQNKQGEYDLLTGNQIGSILTHYVLTSLSEAGKLPDNGVVIKSIVSTRMVDVICKKFGVTLDEVLTGFRFIAECIERHSSAGDKKFLFGFEESYGFLAGGFVRDKDAICASMLIAECCAVLNTRGESLSDLLESMYREYGLFREETRSYTLAGRDGMERIARAMAELRSAPFDAIANRPVRIREDIETGIRTETESGNETKIDLPKSNVLRFMMDNEAWLAVRPSGTEPKLKLYAGVRDTDAESAERGLMELLDFVEKRLSETLYGAQEH